MEGKIVSWVGYGYVTEGEHPEGEDNVKCNWCNHLVLREEAIRDGNLCYCSSMCYTFSKEH